MLPTAKTKFLRSTGFQDDQPTSLYTSYSLINWLPMNSSLHFKATLYTLPFPLKAPKKKHPSSEERDLHLLSTFTRERVGVVGVLWLPFLQSPHTRSRPKWLNLATFPSLKLNSLTSSFKIIHNSSLANEKNANGIIATWTARAMGGEGERGRRRGSVSKFT